MKHGYNNYWARSFAELHLACLQSPGVYCNTPYLYLQDRYAVQQALPPIDPSQDWFLVSGEETGGYTILEFTRNWTTCDERDRDIQVSFIHMICMLVVQNLV